MAPGPGRTGLEPIIGSLADDVGKRFLDLDIQTHALRRSLAVHFLNGTKKLAELKKHDKAR